MIGRLPWISQESPKLYWKNAKKSKNDPFNHKKLNFLKNVVSLRFPMVQGSLNPNIIFLHEKLWPVAWKHKFTSVIQGKEWKMPIKSVKMKISEAKNMSFFLMSQWSLDPKIRFLGQKVCSVAHVQTDWQTDTKVNTEDILLRVSGIFPSTHHQGSVQYEYTPITI